MALPRPDVPDRLSRVSLPRVPRRRAPKLADRRRARPAPAALVRLRHVHCTFRPPRPARLRGTRAARPQPLRRLGAAYHSRGVARCRLRDDPPALAVMRLAPTLGPVVGELVAAGALAGACYGVLHA